jgi:hypothetical protein
MGQHPVRPARARLRPRVPSPELYAICRQNRRSLQCSERPRTRTSSVEPMTGADPAPVCVLTQATARLTIDVVSYRDLAVLRSIIRLAGNSGLGSCTPARDSSRAQTIYHCTSTAKRAPDFSGAPEVAVYVFTGRSAARALWTGRSRGVVPRDVASRTTILQQIATTAMDRYGKV